MRCHGGGVVARKIKENKKKKGGGVNFGSGVSFCLEKCFKLIFQLCVFVAVSKRRHIVEDTVWKDQ